MTVLKRLFYEEDGQGMVEYGLIIDMIAVEVIVALGALGGGIKGIFEDVNAKLGEETTP